ncbi:ROK family protein [Lentzea sp. CA-135723]|uniref:ROK family protein n=1 Tax=Lentzea sp. CA-135723 TaxID=3239950 RepID=UPI003D949CF5
MLAGIKGSGAEFRAVVGTGPHDVRAEEVFPTTTADETIARVTGFLAAQGEFEHVGLACFGPLDLDPRSATYGHITSSLKPTWRDYDLLGAVRAALPVPVTLEIDVNASALGECAAGAGVGKRSVVFMTVGKGTGIGAVLGGRPLRGRSHPEMGHLPVARHPSDVFAGTCPAHGDCFEGLVNPAGLAARGLSGHEQALLAAWYLAQVVMTMTYSLSPEVIVLDGAVGTLPGVLPALREATLDRLGADPAMAGVKAAIDTYVVASPLGGRAGVLGTLLLDQAYESEDA